MMRSALNESVWPTTIIIIMTQHAFLVRIGRLLCTRGIPRWSGEAETADRTK
jgi:hypothetical protein